MDGDRSHLNGEAGAPFTVRTLRREDTPRLAKIDAAITGRSRTLWLEGRVRQALEQTLEQTDVGVSLGAESDGLLVGALLCSVRFGEFGLPEPVAVLDTVLVDPEFAGRGVATAMLDQLVVNLRALRVVRLRTEVAWNELELVAFFGKSGFTPAPRLVLEREV